jgi:hypothetical protein
MPDSPPLRSAQLVPACADKETPPLEWTRTTDPVLEGKEVPKEVFTKYRTEHESIAHNIQIVGYATLAGMFINLIITILLAVDQRRSRKEVPATSNP